MNLNAHLSLPIGAHGKWPEALAGGEQSFNKTRVPQTAA